MVGTTGFVKRIVISSLSERHNSQAFLLRELLALLICLTCSSFRSLHAGSLLLAIFSDSLIDIYLYTPNAFLQRCLSNLMLYSEALSLLRWHLCSNVLHQKIRLLKSSCTSAVIRFLRSVSIRKRFSMSKSPETSYPSSSCVLCLL